MNKSGVSKSTVHEYYRKYMNHNYLYIFLAFLLGIGGCKKEDIDSFDVVRRISIYDSIYSDKNDILGPVTDMEIYNHILVTKHSKDDHYFSFIDTDQGKLCRKWGTKGRGPGEYIQLGPGFTVLDSQLVILDGAKKEINYVPIADILEKNDSSIQVKKESYPYTKDFRPNTLNILKNKKIALGYFKEGRFGILDSVNNPRDGNFDYPFPYENVKGIDRGTVFQSKIKSSNLQERFVIFTLNSDVFEIYHVGDTAIRQVFVSPFHAMPIVQKRGKRYSVDYRRSIAGLMKMAVSDDLVCFTYSSATDEDAGRLGKASDEILCFDWDGKKVVKYILPFPVSAFCIDKDYIYGVRYQENECVYYRFKM